jgi:hypothetical protein
MKFSELVFYRNQLDNLSCVDVKLHARYALEKIIHTVNSQTIISHDLESQNIALQNSFDNFENHLVDLKKEIDQIIYAEESTWLEQSELRYQQYSDCYLNQSFDSNDPLLNDFYIDNYGIRRFGIDPIKTTFTKKHNTQWLDDILEPDVTVKEILHNRILLRTDWRFSAMVIHPGKESFIDLITANDPVYIVDDHKDLFQPVLDKFNPVYQRRLRPYVINKTLDKLPSDQIALCVAYNYFNYKPLSVIKQYLEEIFKKLMPGGVLCMTINDCDRHHAVMLIEHNVSYYTPGRLIFELAQSIGYKCIFKWHNNSTWTWIELQRPGKTTSIRGGQSLAKIINK